MRWVNVKYNIPIQTAAGASWGQKSCWIESVAALVGSKFERKRTQKICEAAPKKRFTHLPKNLWTTHLFKKFFHMSTKILFGIEVEKIYNYEIKINNLQ